jgi:hypothetical protein
MITFGPDEDEAKLRTELPANYPAEAEQLGRPRFRTERRPWTRDSPKGALASLITALLGYVFLFAATRHVYLYLFDRQENFPEGAPFPSFSLWFGLLVALPWSIGLTWLGVWLLIREVRKTRAYAVVYPAGFVLYDGGRFTVWRWADVTRVNMQNLDLREFVLFIQTQRLLTKRYRLRRDDGGEYQFWSTLGPRAAQFGTLVEQETYARMLPTVQAKLNGGETVAFGPFQVNRAGLIYRDHLTPWPDVGPLSIEQGRLIIKGVGPQGSLARVLLEEVDNYHVFLPLLEQEFALAIEN